MQSDWAAYKSEFERTVMIPLFESGLLHQKSKMVSLRPGKLANSPFGCFIDSYFTYDGILAFDYYGLSKLSTGLLKEAKIKNIMLIKAPVIHFNSIKVKHIEEFNRDLLQDFVQFKNYLVKNRWG